MARVETETRRIVARLKHEGWSVERGKEHDIYRHSERPGLRIVVPRHRRLSMGVARDIAKHAAWL